jgi:hypothetical protein
MTPIQPFQNEAESLIIDDLTVENRLDRISLYGSLQITRDKAGLKDAQALKAIIDAVVRALKTETLPEHIALIAPDETDNPFQ